MSELEEKLGAMLSNPQLMQQISSLVQAMGQPSQPAPSPPPMPEPPPQPPEPDFSQLQGLASLLHFGHLPLDDAVKLYQQYSVKIPFVEDLPVPPPYGAPQGWGQQ